MGVRLCEVCPSLFAIKRNQQHTDFGMVRKTARRLNYKARGKQEARLYEAAEYESIGPRC